MCTYVFVYTYMCTYDTAMYVCVCVCRYIYACMYAYVCVCVCMYVYLERYACISVTCTSTDRHAHTHMQVSVTEAAAGDVIIVASDGLWNAFGGRRPPGDVSQEEKGLSGELLVRSCTIYMYTYMYIHTYVQGVSQG